MGALAAGRLLRFFGEAALGRIYGRQVIDVVAAHYLFMEKLLIVLAIGMLIGGVVYFAWYRPKAKRAKHSNDTKILSANNAHERLAR
jgi:hypothetical protein